MPQEPQAPFIPSTEAAKRFNLTNDHIGLLCRRGTVVGTLLGRLWYVSEPSLVAYLKKNSELKEVRRRALSKQWHAAWTAAVIGLVLASAWPDKMYAQVPLVLPARETTTDPLENTFKSAQYSIAAAVASLPEVSAPSLADARRPPETSSRELPFFYQIESGFSQISDTLSEKFADFAPSHLHVTYARDYRAEAKQKLSVLTDINDVLSRTNDNILALYAASGKKFVAAAAVNADAAKVILDSAGERSISLAGALGSVKMSDVPISVASVAYVPDISAAVGDSMGQAWSSAVNFVSDLFARSISVAFEKFSIFGAPAPAQITPQDAPAKPVSKNSSGRLGAQGPAVGFQNFPQQVSPPLAPQGAKQYPVAEPRASEGVVQLPTVKPASYSLEHYVTQDSLNKQFAAWLEVTGALIASGAPSTYIQNPQVAALGNGSSGGGGSVINNYITQHIDKLDGVTITNSSINGTSDFSSLGATDGVGSWFTPSAFGASASNATSSLIGFNSGFYSLASSTIGDGAAGLTISGAATTTGRAYFGGNVGIGTSTPGALLDVSGGNSWFGRTDNTYSSIQLRRNGATVGGISSANSQLTLFGGSNDASVHLNITSAGKVGVGSTSPWGLLSVNPNGISGPAFVIGSSTATKFIVDSAGNVGIGTTTPWSILSIGTTNGINFSTATSTFNSTGGINLAAGCFSVNDVCVGGAGTFLALSDTPSSFNANRILYETSSAVTDNSSFTFDGTTFTVPGFTMANGTITYSSATKNVIQNNTASAWTIATSSTATPLIQIDTTTGSELVTIGKRGGSVQIGDATTPTNLVFGGSSTISGGGLYTLTFGTTGDVIQYGVGIKPSTTNVFNLGASGSNWGCLYYNNSTLGTCASDERLKTGITDLSFDTATSSALEQLTGLRLRSFAYKSAPTSIYDGLIAQEVLSVAPGLVVEDASTTMLAVKYGDIQWLTVAALQQLNAKFNALLGGASSTDQTVDTPPFLSRLLGWFASATNGIGDFFANRVHTKELCVTKTDGIDVCISGDQLAAVLAGQSVSASAVSAGSASPVITILGLNPAHIVVGSSYSDLGATVTDDKDINLGIYISVDGGATTTPDLVHVDTAAAGTHSILYSVTDNDGNTTTATRQVMVGEVATPSVSPSTPATDIATSTSVADTAHSTDPTSSSTLNSTHSNTSGQASLSQTVASTTP